MCPRLVIAQCRCAEREQRAGHAERDVPHRSADCHAHLGGLGARARKDPAFEATSASHLGQRLLVRR